MQCQQFFLNLPDFFKYYIMIIGENMKILASDFDNTLYVEDENILFKNIEMLRKFISNNKVCIITGRSYPNIMEEINKYQIPYTYLICQDGAKIFLNTGECINTIALPTEELVKVVKILDTNHINFNYDNGYEESDNPEKCVKITIKYQDYSKAKELVDIIKQNTTTNCYLSKEHINITAVDANKKNALYYLLNKFNINKEALYVIGDDINDYEMIKTFSGAIMKKHHANLNNLSKKEFTGLYEYIEKLMQN